ncbi:hypothetical protein AAII07_07660 [Microvirga sp. 0TCS3.31]
MPNETEHLRPPFSVHMSDGPEGTQEFGYSDGLLEILGHELLVWTRPTDGVDPGLDWPRGKRGVQVACLDILDAAARGALKLNEPLERELANGMVVMTVRDPMTALGLRASALAPHTPVAPVGWELRRDDFGPLLPIETTELPGLVRKVREVVAALRSDGDVPDDLVVDVGTLDEASFTVSDAYGPASPLVRAVAASIATADQHVVGGLLDNALLLGDVGEYQHRFDGYLTAVARGAGRSAALSRCDELAKTLSIAAPDHMDTDRFEMAVRVTLKTAALHDRLDDADRMRGYGPWETSLYFPERPTGQEATEETIASVEAALSALTPDALAELVDRHGGDGGSGDLQAYAISHRTGLPRDHPLLHLWADRSVRHIEDVRPLLTTLMSATAWRHEDGESDDDTSAYVGWGMVDEYGDLLPSLGLLLRLGSRPEDY